MQPGESHHRTCKDGTQSQQKLLHGFPVGEGFPGTRCKKYPLKGHVMLDRCLATVPEVQNRDSAPSSPPVETRRKKVIGSGDLGVLPTCSNMILAISVCPCVRADWVHPVS